MASAVDTIQHRMALATELSNLYAALLAATAAADGHLAAGAVGRFEEACDQVRRIELRIGRVEAEQAVVRFSSAA